MPNDISFGAQIIPILTSGMYKTPEFIFREYIQNAADQIDKERDMQDWEDKILIEIDKDNKSITIKDGATGIPKDKVWPILANIANSRKRSSSEKGMFGIGRLGGLTYCDKLIFETSYRGESVKSVMTWDAQLLREKTANEHNGIASEIIASVIDLVQEHEEETKHYFTVILKNVHADSKKLLDVYNVREYLKMTAPVGIIETRFSLYGKVREYIKDNSLPTPPEYKIYVNRDKIEKAYRRKLYIGQPDEIDDIKFRLFKDIQGNVMAWAWVGIRNFDKQKVSQINDGCPFRGIRLRLHNIQIGEEDALSHLYKEPRGSKYFIGEIHVIDTSIRPNARRDYFESSPRFTYLENEIKKYLDELWQDVRLASQNASDKKKIVKYQEEEKKFQKKQEEGFISPEEIKIHEENLRKSRKEAENAQRRLQKKDPTYINTIPNIDSSVNKDSDGNSSSDTKKSHLITDRLHGYGKKERKIVSRILDIIAKYMSKETDRYQELTDRIISGLMEK